MKGVTVTAASWETGTASGSIGAEEENHRREEEVWVARSKGGDLDAFALIYHRYEAAVFHYACRLLENADEADDIRQETFLRAYRSIGKFRGEARLRTYLFAICGNLCRDRLRRHQRHPEDRYGVQVPETTMDVNHPAHQEDPLSGLQRAADAVRVRRALRRLSPSDREVLLLRHVEGLDMEEIAIILGCTRVSVPVRLFRARGRFKSIFMTLLNEEGE